MIGLIFATPYWFLATLILMVYVMATIRPKVVADDIYYAASPYTLNIDLPEAGLMSALNIYCHQLVDTTAYQNNPFMKYLISSISVNQAGQDALNAARPEAFSADYYYKTGRMPAMGWRRWKPAGSIEEEIPILFGEHVNDFEHYVDLSKLNDPKLSITYNNAATGILGETIWDATDWPKFTVVADLIEGPGIPASKGYHSLRQIAQYVPEDSQLALVQLKGARPIKRLLVNWDKLDPQYSMRHSVDFVRIWGENEAWVPFSLNSERWKNLIRKKFGLCTATGQIQYMQGDRYTDCVVDEREYYEGVVQDPPTFWLEYHGGAGRRSVTSICLHGAAWGAGHDQASTMFRYRGIAPWTQHVIDMPKMLDMDYLDPKEHAPVYLELKHTSTAKTTVGGTIRVNIEDLAQV